MIDLPAPDHVPSSTAPAHTCLAGRDVSHDRTLTDLLLRQLPVTLIDDPAQLLRTSFLASLARFDVLALDCAHDGQQVPELVRRLKAAHPTLDIVLVDGRLTQRQLAAAFAAGARDYFPQPYDAALLAERISGLSRQRSQRVAVEARGPGGAEVAG